MPRVKIDYIVSFSSEDSEHPASALLAWDVSKKKWLCSKGEPSCSVVLQLAKAVKISSVSIGAYRAALVEVLVGRSETPNDPFQVLVPSSVFQSPAEARRAADAASGGRVRSFAAAALAEPARHQRWDRVRLVATQPYNKHCQFGVSFVHVFSEEQPAPAAPPPPAPDPPSSDEEFRPGELFAQHQRRHTNTDTGAQIRQASSLALNNIPDASVRLSRGPRGAGSPGAARPASSPGAARPASSPGAARPAGELPAPGDRRRHSLLYSPEDDAPSPRVDALLRLHERDHHKHDTSAAPAPTRPHGAHHAPPARADDAGSSRLRQAEGRGCSPRGKRALDAADKARRGVLAGVHCVLSGYENPRRARLRSAALALGAGAHRDWHAACTHLICAFPNTPKLRAVRAGPGGRDAHVVLGEWVEACARTGRRLPERWFATEPARRQAPPPGWEDARQHLRHDDDGNESEDTDDEIERVRKVQRASSPPPPPRRPPPAAAGDVSAGSDVMFVADERIQGGVVELESDSGGSTDEERAGGPAGRRRALPALLAGRSFSVAAPPAQAAVIQRYLAAYGGLVLHEEAAEYVVCSGGVGGGAARGAGVRLRAAWLWRCHKEQRLVPLDTYTLP